MRFLVHRLLLLAILLACTLPAAAQHARLIPLDHWAYDYIQRLQRRGHLLELHPTALPYSEADLRAALREVDRGDLGRREERWFKLLVDEFRRRPVRRSVRAGAELQPGARLASDRRLDALRPVDEGSSELHALGMDFYPNAAGRVFMASGPVVAQVGLRFDLYYRNDPDGLDAANRLVTRNHETYVGFRRSFVSAYLGRYGRHWGPYRESALLISENPVAADAIQLRIGGSRLALNTLIGELDSMTEDGRFTGTAGADSVQGNVRRFIAAHRFDWRPSRHVAITLMESAVYSGTSSGLSLKYLNPLNIYAFAVDGRPKNDENNGLLAGILWAQFGSFTLQGQLMIDDIDLMGETGEPASAALSGSVIYAGLPAVDLGGTFTAVTARAYNTHQPEGRYIYLLRGIATQFSDFVHASAFTTFYADGEALGLSISPRIDLLFQGQRDIRQDYPTREQDVDLILDGEVLRILRPAIELRLQHGRRIWMNVDVGPAFTNDDDLGTRFTATASISALLGIEDRIRMAF